MAGLDLDRGSHPGVDDADELVLSRRETADVPALARPLHRCEVGGTVRRHDGQTQWLVDLGYTATAELGHLGEAVGLAASVRGANDVALLDREVLRG